MIPSSHQFFTGQSQSQDGKLKVNLCSQQRARWHLQPFQSVRAELIDKITTICSPTYSAQGAIPADKDFQHEGKRKTTLHEPEMILILSPLFLMPVSEQKCLHKLSFIQQGFLFNQMAAHQLYVYRTAEDRSKRKGSFPLLTRVTGNSMKILLQ